jgi:hypothetical protein
MQTKEAIEKERLMYQYVEQWQRSGMTKKEFGRHHGFTRDMFSYWVKKYQTRHRPEQPSPFISLAIEEAGKFIPSPLTSSTRGIHREYPQPGSSNQAHGQEVEIRYPNGVRLSLQNPTGIDVAMLRSLVTLL